jgi:hypothetical protein
VRDRRLKAHAALGPRLAGLAILSAALFALATVVGMFANGLA